MIPNPLPYEISAADREALPPHVAALYDRPAEFRDGWFKIDKRPHRWLSWWKSDSEAPWRWGAYDLAELIDCTKRDPEHSFRLCSPALALLETTLQALPDKLSDRERGYAMSRSLRTALDHLRFDQDDWWIVVGRYRVGGRMDVETCYARAVGAVNHSRRRTNVSACRAIETWLSRPPYLAPSKVVHGASGKALRRVAVGTDLHWPATPLPDEPTARDYHVEVTSLGEEYLVAVAHEGWTAGEGPVRHDLAERKVWLAWPTTEVEQWNKAKEHQPAGAGMTREQAVESARAMGHEGPFLADTVDTRKKDFSRKVYRQVRITREELRAGGPGMK